MDLQSIYRIKKWNVSNNNMVAFGKFRPDPATFIFYVCFREWIDVYMKSAGLRVQEILLKGRSREAKSRERKVVSELE